MDLSFEPWGDRTCPWVRCRQGRKCPLEALTGDHGGNMSSPRRRKWACPEDAAARAGHVLWRLCGVKMVAICPLPAAGDGHVLRMPRPGMGMSFAAGRYGACPAD